MYVYGYFFLGELGGGGYQIGKYNCRNIVEQSVNVLELP